MKATKIKETAEKDHEAPPAATEEEVRQTAQQEGADPVGEDARDEHTLQGDSMDGQREQEDVDPVGEDAADEHASQGDSLDRQRELEALQERLKQSEDRVLRMTAEMENLRRRTEKKIAQSIRFANEAIIKALLPVLDSFETAQKNAADADLETLLNGFEMTEKQFFNVLEKSGVEWIHPAAGDRFDAALHQALSAQRQEGLDDNVIVTVYQRGVQLYGRLLRPALVVVNKSD